MNKSTVYLTVLSLMLCVPAMGWAVPSSTNINQVLNELNQSRKNEYNVNRQKAYTEMKARVDALIPAQRVQPQPIQQISPLQPVAGLPSPTVPTTTPRVVGQENQNTTTTGSGTAASAPPTPPATPNIFSPTGSQPKGPSNIYR